jgi:hypothetical protein
MATISIAHKGISYESVSLTLNDGTIYEFKTGDFMKDWYQAKKKFLEFHKQERGLENSPSVDEFIHSGAPYDYAYATYVDDVPTLLYEWDGRGWMVFVNKGTKPTWEEYKQHCKS